MVCPRCFRRADRLIKGDLCVSCYNRQREVRIGRDRKGARPGLTDRLHTVQVRVRRGKKSELVRFDGVTGLPEVMLRVVKADPASVSISRPRVVWWPGQSPQLELPLDFALAA